MSKELERLNNKNLPCSNCKELKAFKIIKEKEVQVADLLDCISNEKADYVESGLVEYNGWHFEYRQLTEEEYDLLKEMLKDE